MTGKTLCRYNKFGHCKYGDKCHFRHENEKCLTKDCKINDCEKRHPKICIYKRKFGNCKFTTYCSYEHEKSLDICENSDKIVELEKKIENLQQNTNINYHSDLAKKVDIKIETFENKMKILIQLIEEKDSIIKNLEKKLNLVGDKFEKKIEHLENSLKKEQNKSENNHIKCDQCDFTTTSTKGLKTHVRRKHPSISQEVFPLACELCTEELKSKNEMRLHMISHSYIMKENNDLKCEHCDFIGKNDWTMQMHYGKSHSKIMECGLCQFVPKDLENLNIHLKTCETYECDTCDHVTKTIANMKKHIRESKECESSTIYHIKIDRKDVNEANSKEYKQSEIF